jgi:hypothetical protein
VLIVRLKQCEHALADGRLDRAFDLARESDFRADRRGQELIGRLAQQLALRGQEHVEAQRVVEAAADCEKAQSLGGNMPQVAQLRRAIADATAKRMDDDRVRGQALAAARRHIDAGQLTMGGNLLTAADGDARADSLQQEIDNKRATLQSALTKASAAFAAGDWENAVDQLAGLRRQFPADSSLRDLSSKINQQVTAKITAALEGGRLDLAAALLNRLDRLAHPSVELDQIRAALGQCRAAFELLRETEAQQATEILRRLAPLWPKAAWMKPAVGHLEQLAESLKELRSGPLALTTLAPMPIDPHQTMMPESVKPVSPTPIAPPKLPATPSGSRFVLHVDGVASFAVLTQPVVTIGPVSSSSAPDVALLAGAGMPTISISRTEDDYVLQAREQVLVNDKPTTGKLLASGDKINLGPRCRVTFRRPSAASGTAVLDLSGARLPRGDVRQVILADREILIGPGSTAHVRSDDLAQAAILQPNRGKLTLRSSEAIQIDGQPAPKQADIPVGAHVRLGPVSFVVTHE